jgi:hypothetical protein
VVLWIATSAAATSPISAAPIFPLKGFGDPLLWVCKQCECLLSHPRGLIWVQQVAMTGGAVSPRKGAVSPRE